jgi:hypothetical protein
VASIRTTRNHYAASGIPPSEIPSGANVKKRLTQASPHATDASSRTQDESKLRSKTLKMYLTVYLNRLIYKQ